MGHPERTCRECGQRFAPTRFDQVHCGTCSQRLRDVHLIHDTLFSSPHQSVDRVAISTGLSIERIRDLAAEMANLTRLQILSQSGTAMLAQANQTPQSVLQLLQN